MREAFEIRCQPVYKRVIQERLYVGPERTIAQEWQPY